MDTNYGKDASGKMHCPECCAAREGRAPHLGEPPLEWPILGPVSAPEWHAGARHAALATVALHRWRATGWQEVRVTIDARAGRLTDASASELATWIAGGGA